MNSDIDPVIGKKRGSDGLYGIFVAGDREKDDPLSIHCKGIGVSVKPLRFNRDQSGRTSVVRTWVVVSLRAHLHFTLLLVRSWFDFRSSRCANTRAEARES